MNNYNREFLLLSAAYGLLFFGFNGAEQHLTSYQSVNNQSPIALTSLTILYCFLLVGSLVAPFVMTVLSLRTTQVLGFVCYSVYVFAIISKSSTLIFTMSGILGLASGIMGVGRYSLFHVLVPEERRGKYIGFSEAVRMFLGFLGVASVGLLLSSMTMEAVFLLYGTLMLFATALLFLIRERPKPSSISKYDWNLMLKIAQDNRLYWLVAYPVVYSFLFGLVLGAIPTMIQSHYSPSHVGWVTAIFYLMLAAVTPWAGLFSDRQGRLSLIYCSYFSALVGILLFLYLPVSLLSLGILMGCFGLAGSLAAGAHPALMLDLFEHNIKEAAAIQNSVGLIIGAIPAFILPFYLTEAQLLGIALIFVILGILSLRVFEVRYMS